jgi:hypothetical protein
MMDAVRKQKLSITALLVVAVVATVVVAMLPAIPQSPGYHSFSDNRTLYGIPNFWNVISNAPFLLVGLLGLREVIAGHFQGGLPRLRIAYGAFFACIALVCFGSGYYHWAPSNATLTWDRLPMAIAFMIFLSIAISEHINERLGLHMLLPLVALGVFSVWYWDYTENLGRGDLRLYALVQFLSLVILAMIFALLKSRFAGNGYLWAMFGGYAAAKLLEELDGRIFSLGGVISGHALKHVAAAGGMYFFVLALKLRRIRE